jgi:L-alanine-DL-glutamate epimerase-like enolase superfamily enzyme
MRWYGLRDFKLKLGLGEEADAENLRILHKRIGKAVRQGKCTLRVDVNGAWEVDETPARIEALRPYGVCVVEQPVFGPPEALIALAQRCALPLMADESMVTAANGAELIEAAGRKVWMNIRLSKNGGLWPSLGIARAAAEAGVPFTIGCMVGESSILSAAQRELLRLGPAPRFVEGNYGKLLLRDDLTDRSLRFGYGGRLRRLPGGSAGVAVSDRKLARYGVLVKTLRP